MKLRKLVACVISFSMSIAAFTGCNSKSEDNSSNQSNSSITAKVETPLKFSVTMSDTLIKYITQSSDIKNDKWIQEINKRANVEIIPNFLDHKKYGELLQMMLASGDVTDVVVVAGNWRSTDLAGSIEAGLYMPIDNLLEKNKDKLKNLMAKIPQTAWDEAKNTSGKTWGMPISFASASINEGAYIRKDLLNKYGLKVPSTLDEWVEVMKVFKKNGMKYPYWGREKWQYSTLYSNAFGVNMNASQHRWNLNENGEMVPDFIRPEMKEALKFYAKIKEDGLMNPESLTVNSNVWLQKIYAGEVGMFNFLASQLGAINTSLKANVPDGEYMLVPSPVGPKGAKGSPAGPVISYSAFINKNFKEPDRLMKYFDYMATEEMQEFLAYGGVDKSAYKAPTNDAEANEAGFRELMRFFKDTSYNKYTLQMQPNGDQVMKWFQEVAPKEGYHAYKVEKLETYKVKPELFTYDLWYQYSAKIFLGTLPIDAFDEFVKEYRKRGGDDAIKEATQLYKSGELQKY